ncbi:hypothetical protein AAG570_010249 [Ranatra chinensis]|uniref:UBZ1-type domain-containing protein n=1 Tax=Ranatra chinensis TaxID=642074 RepID=A0ABD0Z059_9HEMI
MKERCQKLQNRLSRLEDENLQLRIEKKKLYSAVNKHENFVSISALEKKVAELSRQKSQLSHHILMVATENKELWQRLSKLTEENESLGNHLINITDSLKKQPEAAPKPDKSIDLVESCDGGKDESLEEISIKVINSLMKGKNMLENQCEEMLELQDGNVNIDQCGFVLEDKDDGAREDDSLLGEMKDVLERMSSERTILKQQQDGLKAALDVFQKVSAEGLPCKKCAERAKEEDEVQAKGVSPSTTPDSLRKVDSKDVKRPEGISEPPNDTEHPSGSGPDPPTAHLDRICPLCGAFFKSSTPFTDFNDHVLSHFVEPGPDEPDSIISNFEIIP